jgi:hypothetical protein
MLLCMLQDSESRGGQVHLAAYRPDNHSACSGTETENDNGKGIMKCRLWTEDHLLIVPCPSFRAYVQNDISNCDKIHTYPLWSRFNGRSVYMTSGTEARRRALWDSCRAKCNWLWPQELLTSVESRQIVTDGNLRYTDFKNDMWIDFPLYTHTHTHTHTHTRT